MNDDSDLIRPEWLDGLLKTVSAQLQDKGYTEAARIARIAEATCSNKEYRYFEDPDDRYGEPVEVLEIKLHLRIDEYNKIPENDRSSFDHVFTLYRNNGSISKVINQELWGLINGVTDSRFEIEYPVICIVPLISHSNNKNANYDDYLGRSNNGRVNSRGIPKEIYKGLLFRGPYEILTFKALEAMCITFAPLPAVMNYSDVRKYRGERPKWRSEPDFILFLNRCVILLEIDGSFHENMTALQEYNRLESFSSHIYKTIRIGNDEYDRFINSINPNLNEYDNIQRIKKYLEKILHDYM